jgi:hypothetical protein
MHERDTGDGNHDIMEFVVLTRGRAVHIFSTAPTPKSIFSRHNMLVYDHGGSTNSFNGAINASPHPMIPVLIMLPTKLVNVIQYGGNVKAISLLPFWGDKLMEQVIHGEDFGPDLFQI